MSLYASQPDELPRLTHDAHKEISATIGALTGLLLLADVHIKRKLPHAARPLVALGERMARRANHHIALTLAQSFEHLFSD